MTLTLLDCIKFQIVVYYDFLKKEKKTIIQFDMKVKKPISFVNVILKIVSGIKLTLFTHCTYVFLFLPISLFLCHM